MKGMSLESIAEACGGTYRGDESLRAAEVTGVVTDSRAAEPGNLYVALRGEHVDGHRFIPDAFAAGAAAVLSEEEISDPAGPVIRVSSCPQALEDIAAYYRSTLSLPIVGITGSVGKTGTKEMVSSVLAQKYNVLKTEGNFNNEIGLPLTLLRIRPEHEVAVVEMGISEFGEMHRLARMAKPDICVITNIGPCHLETLGDRDGVLRAKSEIFDYLKPDGVIVLNGNDEKLATIREVKGVRPRFFFVCDGSVAPGCGAYFLTADGIVNHGLSGMDAVLHFPGGDDCTVTEPIPGSHNLYNVCAAACVGDALGLTHAQICAGIAAAHTLSGREHVVRANGITILDDCYNASPDAMRASLAVLGAVEGRKIAVLGDMLELGERAETLHREVGVDAAAHGIDRIYCTGKLAQEIADAAVRDGCAAMHFETKEALLERLLTDIKEGDTILVKASHGMEFSGIVEALRNRRRKDGRITISSG